MKIKSIFLIVCLFNFSFAGEVSEYIKIEPRNNFILVLDKSGSMKGNPLEQAKRAILSFLNKVQKNDKVGMVTFSDRSQKLFSLTQSPHNQIKQINSIKGAGATALYDALALAFKDLKNLTGAKIIVYLTDGNDNKSYFSIADIHSMSKSENIFIYGIGLGDVQTDNLHRLSNATEGFFTKTENPLDLENIYNNVLEKYYEEYGNSLLANGALTIKSIPGNLPVSLSGRKSGRTPVSISNLSQGEYRVIIDYPRGKWQCDAEVKPGYRGIINARESGVSYDLIVSSRPVKSAVFLDNSYIGNTAIKPIIKENKFWGGKKIKNLKDQLKIQAVPKGEHTLKLVAMPGSDVDLGTSLVYEFRFNINKNTIVNVDILKKRADFIGSRDQQQSLKDKVNDSFQELEDF
jgi:uncharacterized protein YegL